MTKFRDGIDNVFNFKVKSGSEGPKHDPYGYSEYSFEYRGRKYIIHMGLAQWIEVNDKCINATDCDGHNWYDEEDKFVNYVIGEDFYTVLSSLIHNHFNQNAAPSWYEY